MNQVVPITVAYGDGIGPEIMHAVIYILKNAEARIRLETIEVGEKLYKKNYSSGIATDTWDSLQRTKILLKSPITTPQGGGYKSLNVTLRKALGLYANIRPAISYYPFIKTKHPDLDVVIIRENEEDLYAGIEYRHTRNVYESVKLISRVGCAKISKFAFEYAVSHKRKKVTCFTKDNIMKFSEGILHKVFNEIAAEYSQIANEHYIVDIGTARLATHPESFDVIVTSNLFGDIISDITSEISGSIGLAGSANIGPDYAMFEGVHGSAPNIAGQDIANPSGLLHGAIMMLAHIGQGDVAATIENSWKRTIEEGIHTADIYNSHTSTKQVGTMEFAQAIVKRLGQTPQHLKLAECSSNVQRNHALDTNTVSYGYQIDMSEQKTLVGVDIFIDMHAQSADEVAAKIQGIDTHTADILCLQMIATKGLILWPREHEHITESDHWCCRFMSSTSDHHIVSQNIISLLNKITAAGIDFIKVENLYNYNGIPGYSLAQGE